ncbi:MAG: hypothetical protein Q8P67_10000 [archaeon]|nr:hypothetical protein [archaeon]
MKLSIFPLRLNWITFTTTPSVSSSFFLSSSSISSADSLFSCPGGDGASPNRPSGVSDVCI